MERREPAHRAGVVPGRIVQYRTAKGVVWPAIIVRVTDPDQWEVNLLVFKDPEEDNAGVTQSVWHAGYDASLRRPRTWRMTPVEPGEGRDE